MTIAGEDTRTLSTSPKIDDCSGVGPLYPICGSCRQTCANHLYVTGAAHVTPGIGSGAAHYVDELSMRAMPRWRRFQKNRTVSRAAFVVNAEVPSTFRVDLPQLDLGTYSQASMQRPHRGAVRPRFRALWSLAGYRSADIVTPLGYRGARQVIGYGAFT
jgi:hypothetical protein